ncbi:hypothetical protein LCGC14_0383260 [marine sediment metagenome]|uniref:Uncharacterized protein n=1 Tax=marine sediment metagenome TaxID=412755 RepID=A0A0F9TJT3_9ZZZZ
MKDGDLFLIKLKLQPLELQVEECLRKRRLLEVILKGGAQCA